MVSVSLRSGAWATASIRHEVDRTSSPTGPSLWAAGTTAALGGRARGDGGRAGFRGVPPAIAAAGMLLDDVQTLEDGLVDVEVGGVEGRSVGYGSGGGGCRRSGGYRDCGSPAIPGVGFVVGRLIPGVKVDLGGVVVVVVLFSAAHLA